LGVTVAAASTVGLILLLDMAAGSVREFLSHDLTFFDVLGFIIAALFWGIPIGMMAAGLCVGVYYYKLGDKP
jgi:hypothetical protein